MYVVYNNIEWCIIILFVIMLFVIMLDRDILSIYKIIYNNNNKHATIKCAYIIIYVLTYVALGVIDFNIQTM